MSSPGARRCALRRRLPRPARACRPISIRPRNLPGLSRGQSSSSIGCASISGRKTGLPPASGRGPGLQPGEQVECRAARARATSPRSRRRRGRASGPAPSWRAAPRRRRAALRRAASEAPSGPSIEPIEKSTRAFGALSGGAVRHASRAPTTAQTARRIVHRSLRSRHNFENLCSRWGNGEVVSWTMQFVSASCSLLHGSRERCAWGT